MTEQTIDCPRCGPRPVSEFVCVADATVTSSLLAKLPDGTIVVSDDRNLGDCDSERLCHEFGCGADFSFPTIDGFDGFIFEGQLEDEDLRALATDSFSEDPEQKERVI